VNIVHTGLANGSARALTIVRMIAFSASEAAGRSETETQRLLPNRLLKL
jgi:hypothetical protein